MMQQQKFDNLATSLTLACKNEERKVRGAQCGHIMVVVEIDPAQPDQLRTRFTTGLPPLIAVQAIASVLKSLAPKTAHDGQVDAGPAVPAIAPPTSADESACIPPPVLPS